MKSRHFYRDRGICQDTGVKTGDEPRQRVSFVSVYNPYTLTRYNRLSNRLYIRFDNRLYTRYNRL